MRHLKAHRKLGRTTEHRISLLRNLATSLINSREERIVTTLPKAKELRPFVERAITLSRRAQQLSEDESGAGALHLRRQAAAFFHAGNIQRASLAGRRGQLPLPRTAGMAALRRLFDELGDRYKDRPGGYTRILKLGRRDGDNAELAIIELVDNPREREFIEAAKKRAKAAAAKKQKSGWRRRSKDAGKEKQPVEAKAASEETATPELAAEAVESKESTPDQDTEK
jgi:large subunit ribosomal protein L17